MKVGQKILSLRRQHGLAQQELAHLCGVTASAMSKIESGENSPKAHRVFRIAQVFCVTVHYLLDESSPYPMEAPTRPKIKDPKKMRRTTLTLEEWAHLQHLREASAIAREVSYEVPYLTPDVICVMHRIVMHPEERDK